VFWRLGVSDALIVIGPLSTAKSRDYCRTPLSSTWLPPLDPMTVATGVAAANELTTRVSRQPPRE
jgi:hypothetical protein